MPTTAPIRTGVIGFGLSGRVFHGPFLSADPRFDVTLIATADPERAAQAASLHPGAQIVATPAELLARAQGLDLVVLASPAHAHLEQGLAALEAGAHLVIDKPFAPTLADAKQLISAAEQAGRMLTVFQNRRWDGDFLTVKSLLAQGLLGDIHRFESSFERWGGPLKNRWQDSLPPASGTGITWDIGSHLVDQALQLFGPAELEQVELTRVRKGSQSEDDAFLSLVHENGVRSHLAMSRAAAQPAARFRVLGSAAAYSVDGLDGQEAQLRAGVLPSDVGYGETPSEEWGTVGVPGDYAPVPTERGAYADFYSGVAAAILDGAPAPVDPKDSLDVVRIIERAHLLGDPR